MKLSEVTKGIIGEFISEGEFETLEFCTSKLEISFLSFLENSKFVYSLNENITCIICTKEIVELLPKYIKGVFVAENPKECFYLIHNSLASNKKYYSNSFKTMIGKNCEINEMAYIYPENVKIGNNVIIEPMVVIHENTIIEDNCIIHSGSVIGGKSFAFAKLENGKILGLKDLGMVVLSENVEICSNCHIASGILPTDTTFLDKNVKLDAMVHVAHGVKIGERTLIPAGAQIAGNVTIGKDSWIGVNATIANRVEIGDNAKISLGSVVTKNVNSGDTVTGNFAIPHKKFIDFIKNISK